MENDYEDNIEDDEITEDILMNFFDKQKNRQDILKIGDEIMYDDGHWNRLYLNYDNYLMFNNNVIDIKGSYNSYGGYLLNLFNEVELLTHSTEIFFTIDNDGFTQHKYFIRQTENNHNFMVFVNEDGSFYEDDSYDGTVYIISGTRFNYDNYLSDESELPFDHD